MMKVGKKWLSLLLAAMLTLGAAALLVACGGGSDDNNNNNNNNNDNNPPAQTVDWSAYTEDQWRAELDKFDGKQISYQFNSTDFTQLNGSAMLNLYEDGSACADSYSPGRADGDFYFGYWSEAEDEDGNAITINIVAGYASYMAEGGLFVTKTWSYPSLYELANGNYSFSMDVDLALGQYTRQLSMVCDNTVKYDTFAAFEAYAETAAPEEGGEEGGEEGEEGAVPSQAFSFVYTADSSDMLKDTMICEVSEWGAKLGGSGSYTATDSHELLITFTGSFTKIECYADGTYSFIYENAGLTETGTWTFSGWVMTFTTAGGQSFTCSPAE